MVADPMDMLDEVTSNKPVKKKKGGTPEVALKATEANVVAMKKWIKAKKEGAEAETRQRQAEEVLIPAADELRAKKCQEDKSFYAAAKIVCGDDAVSIVTQNRYSKIPKEKKPELQDIFGGDFEKCFTTQASIKISEEGIKKLDQLLPKLIEAAGGKEEFKKMFEVEQTLEVTDRLHEDRSFNPEVAKKAKEAMDKGILKPVKPSLRM